MSTAQPGSTVAREHADARPRRPALSPSRRRPSAPGRLLPLALASALALSGASCASAGATMPLFHAGGGRLADPAPDSIRNANGSPRGIAQADYAAFRRDVVPRLREWARDARLDLNPAFLAALLAKESAFAPRAVSPSGALGIAQLTVRADTDLRTRAGTPLFAWMLPEIQAWPRDTVLRSLTAPPPATVPGARQLSAAADAAARDYLFDPVLATRAATFWLRMLEAIWTTDTWPGAYGALARQKLNGGNPLAERQLLELCVVSYNQGVEYVRGLVEQWGSGWTEHLDPEPADYLERITFYTLLFQR